MFGYSLPLLFGRLFGVGLFVLGIVFLVRFRKIDDPKRALRQALRSPWVWFFTILAWVAFGFEVAYLAGRLPSL
jgi:Na+/proline symporter